MTSTLNPQTVTLSCLRNASDRSLRQLFDTLEPPAPNELVGPMRGWVINGNTVFGMKSGLYVTNRFWKGKSFAATSPFGRNRLSIFGHIVDFCTFRTGIEPSMEHEGDVFTLRYRYPWSLNPWPIRNIVDEMRRIRDGFYLGTGNISIFSTFYLFDWYVLKRP